MEQLKDCEKVLFKEEHIMTKKIIVILKASFFLLWLVVKMTSKSKLNIYPITLIVADAFDLMKKAASIANQPLSN